MLQWTLVYKYLSESLFSILLGMHLECHWLLMEFFNMHCGGGNTQGPVCLSEGGKRTEKKRGFSVAVLRITANACLLQKHSTKHSRGRNIIIPILPMRRRKGASSRLHSWWEARLGLQRKVPSHIIQYSQRFKGHIFLLFFFFLGKVSSSEMLWPSCSYLLIHSILGTIKLEFCSVVLHFYK